MTETAVTAVVYCRVLFTTLDSSAKDRNLTAPTSRPSPASLSSPSCTVSVPKPFPLVTLWVDSHFVRLVKE